MKPVLDSAEKFQAFYKSLANHQIRIKHHFAQLVTLLESENPYFKYPVIGVLYTFEQSTHLGIVQAIFHELKKDGSLGAPAVVRNPIFTNKLETP